MREEEVISVIKDRKDEKEDNDHRDENKEVYDRGWGWCVVAGELTFKFLDFDLFIFSMFSM